MTKDEFSPTNPNMLFDLRQTYAMQLLTPILLEIKFHRKNADYQRWFETLTEDLFIEVNQKLTPEEREEYKRNYDKCVGVLNNYSTAYKGTNHNQEQKALVKQAIINIELWLKEKMEEHGIYGKGSEYDWDEI
jgi:hypothetical protein